MLARWREERRAQVERERAAAHRTALAKSAAQDAARAAGGLMHDLPPDDEDSIRVKLTEHGAALRAGDEAASKAIAAQLVEEVARAGVARDGP